MTFPGYRRLSGWIASRVGGRASAHVAAVLALVLALDAADLGAVGAMATYLQRDFRIDKAGLGLLAALTSGVAAAATLFFGWLVDRSKRTRMLAIVIALWGLAMLASAAAFSYGFLLISRLALGAFTAVSIPATASLVGDFFPPERRGRMYGFILAGELIGIGFGFIVAGELAIASWRLGFVSLAVPAFLVAWLVGRLPEPARDGSTRIPEGRERIVPPEEERRSGREPGGGSGDGDGNAEEGSEIQLIHRKTRERRIEPRRHLVYDRDPAEKSLWWAVGYVLRIPTNLVLIAASALGYYFLAGAQTFGLEYVQGQYRLGHAMSVWLLMLLGAGALVGVLSGGRLGDRLLARGYLPGRVAVTAGGYLTSAVFFLVGLVWTDLWVAAPALWLAAAALLSASPPLDAARLDIIHGHLWGRAESVRTVFRKAGTAVAPLLFGYIAEAFGGGVPALRKAFLLMLIPVFASGLIALIALRTYPRDAATADAYVRRTRME